MKLKVTILGAGYVGLPTAAHFSNVYDVTVYDPIAGKIDSIKDSLNGKGTLHIHETGLLELLKRNEEKLTFTSNIKEALASPDIIFIAVGTPPNSKGRANLSYICQAANDIANNLKKSAIVLTKSTVPPGTAFLVESIIKETSDETIIVGSCPEFLAEGTAMRDLHSPSRIVVGCNDKDATKTLINFFSALHAREKILTMDSTSAECAKYFANAMLATRLSFINSAAVFAEKVGANIHSIRKSMALDPRIGSKFLYPGFGYGGSCFPKDTKAIAEYAKLLEHPLSIINSTIDINSGVLDFFFQRINDHFDDLKGKNIAVWGIGFKAGTNDVRESQAVILIEKLLQEGANLTIYDAVKDAMVNFKNDHPDNSNYKLVDSKYSVITEDTDALIIGNDEESFRLPEVDILSKMRNKVVFDGKNSVKNVSELKENGFIYKGIGVETISDKKKLVQFLKESYMS